MNLELIILNRHVRNVTHLIVVALIQFKKIIIFEHAICLVTRKGPLVTQNLRIV